MGINVKWPPDQTKLVKEIILLFFCVCPSLDTKIFAGTICRDWLKQAGIMPLILS